MIDKNRSFLIDLARKYYMEGFSQKEIADYYSISRASVSKLLKLCRDENIVEIRIQDDEASLLNSLSERIVKDLGVKRAIVVPSGEDEAAAISAVGFAAARLLEKRLKDRMKIGLSWGSSLYQVVQALSAQEVVDVEVIQLTGSLGMKNNAFDGFELTRKLAEKLNGECHLLQAPVLVKNHELKQLLLREHPLSSVVQKMDDIELALVGISSDDPGESSMVREGFLDTAEAQSIQNQGGIGHICGLHYDKHGQFLNITHNERVVGIEGDQFCRIPEIVAVACGLQKVAAIKGAIKGSLISALVTDKHTALRLLLPD